MRDQFDFANWLFLTKLVSYDRYSSDTTCHTLVLRNKTEASIRMPNDEDWYPRWTQKTQGGIPYNSAHHLEDSRGPWHAPHGIDNYIYKNICKIGK
jgi:hypothetical protein